MSRKTYFTGKELPLNRVTKSHSLAAKKSHTSTKANLLAIQIKAQPSVAEL